MTTVTATDDDQLTDLTDEELVEEALHANTSRRREEAFGELRSRYDFRGLYVQKYGARPEEAEDLEQELWSRVWRHLHRYDQEKFGTTFSTWINTIASNLGKNALRNRSRSPLRHNADVETRVGGENGDFNLLAQTHPEDLGPDNTTQTPLPDPERSYRFNELADAIEEAVEELSPTRKATIRLWLQGFDYEGISREMDVPTGTTKSRLNRARNALADALRERGFEVYGGLLEEKNN